MTDEVQGFGTPQEPAASESIQPDAGAPETPQVVTMDLLRGVLDERFTQLERRLQSLTDKQENRLKKEVDGKVARLEEKYRALGLQMPEGARQRVIDDTVLSFLDNDEQPASQPGAPSPELVAYVNKRATKIAEQAGAFVSPGDPEFTLVNQATADPDEYLESWQRAVTSKANRLRGAGQPAQNQPTTPSVTPAARVPMAGGGPSGSSTGNYERYLAEAHAPGADTVAIRRKWRPLLRKEGIEL